MAQEQSGRNRCNQCGTSFNSENELREHERTAHRQGGSGSERGGSSQKNPGGSDTSA